MITARSRLPEPRRSMSFYFSRVAKQRWTDMSGTLHGRSGDLGWRAMNLVGGQRIRGDGNQWTPTG